ncbi:sulfatase-like hydrolase/transferase [Dactylosporangium sp. CA-092794]|uniref:sulfatase-like hydrolase/transferase n=1 Tax=Dactylosporangium sp. CA-092794 TaxID=3239929 RepID=UPI003D8FA808
MRDDTIVIVTSDHGDMLGECGLWYKMSPFEPSARIPLIIHAPATFAPRRVQQPVSLPDLLPTLVDLADAAPANTAGRSLLRLAWGEDKPGPDIIIEYLAEGLATPQVTVVLSHDDRDGSVEPRPVRVHGRRLGIGS